MTFPAPNQNPTPNPDPYRAYSGSYYVRQTALLGTMMAVLMLCVDVGYAQAQQYSLQSTANLAAFLGAQQLPNREAAASTAATYMRSNGVLDAPERVSIVGDAMVAVELEERYDTIFARWVGIEQVPLRAYAQEQHY